MPIHDILDLQTLSTRNTTHVTTRCRNPISIHYTLPTRSLHDSLHTAHILYTLTTRGHYMGALFTTRNHYIPEPAFTTRPSPAHYTMGSCSEKSCHYMWVRKCCEARARARKKKRVLKNTLLTLKTIDCCTVIEFRSTLTRIGRVFIEKIATKAVVQLESYCRSLHSYFRSLYFLSHSQSESAISLRTLPEN